MIVSIIPLCDVQEKLKEKTRRFDTDRVIDSIKDVTDELLTPEFIEIARASGMYFETTAEGRANAEERRERYTTY